ncbi:MAG: HAMP domain-containing sensor histidine kinase [Spirochaetota bacterium]
MTHSVDEVAWAVTMRWLAAAGLAAGAFAVGAFGVTIEKTPILMTAVCIAVYNTGYAVFVAGLRRRKVTAAPRSLANSQVILDLICITVVLHFTGGAENPFMFYYIFHVVISGIILPARYSALMTLFASVLFLSMVWLEYAGAIAHHAVLNFLPAPLYSNTLFVICVSFVFVSLMFIALYMVTNIAGRLAERERRIADANRQLKEKDRVKSEYVLRVSHDIKGHIAAIQSCIHPVQAGITGPLTDDQKNLLDRAETRTEHLLAFVKSLLNLTIARLKEGTDNERFDIARTVSGAIELALPTAKNNDIAIDSDLAHDCPALVGSSAEIQAAFLELISNAIKYTRAGGTVRVTITCGQDAVIATVSDDGVGIPAGELPMIFNEFYRSSRTAADVSGTGLGLAMTKHVIEKHGGVIHASSVEGRGTVFSIELPVPPVRISG